jgi:hypothetical protein
MRYYEKIARRYYDEIFMDILSSEFSGRIPQIMERKRRK